MNLSLISSRALREVWGSSVRRRVMGRLTVPGTAPCSDHRKGGAVGQKTEKHSTGGEHAVTMSGQSEPNIGNKCSMD